MAMGKHGWVTAVVALVGLVILAGLFNFNQHHYVDDNYLLTNIGALLWLPMMFIFLGFREDPSNFGFAVGDARKGYGWALVLFLLLLPFMIYYSHNPIYQSYYPMSPQALNGFQDLCRFELLYGVYLFCWEFFFRGFLLFGLSRSFGVWSVFAQAIPFGMMHLGKPEFYGSFISGVILGALARKSKSFMPCFILHWAISLTFDVLVISAKHAH